MRIPVLLFLAALAAGCVHKIDVEQGNYVTQDVVERLKAGMSKQQVKMLLGTPLLTDIFHADRWDYYFDNAKAGRKVAHKHLVLFFKDEKLASWSGDANPPPLPPVRSEAPEAPKTPPTAAPASASPATPAPAEPAAK